METVGGSETESQNGLRSCSILTLKILRPQESAGFA